MKTRALLSLLLLTACDVGDISLGDGEDDTGSVDTQGQSGGQEGEDFEDDTGDLPGETTSSGLHTSSNHMEFGPRYIGCDADSNVLLTNQGGTAVAVEAVSLSTDSGEFTLQDGLTLPLTLSPGQSAALGLRYAPLDRGSDAVTIDLRLDQPGETLRISAEGQGDAYSTAQDDLTGDGIATRFDLQAEAVHETIAVRLDGVALAADAWYTADQSIVLLSPPPEGARLQITYAVPPPSCD